jgi:hypothetical protein
MVIVINEMKTHTFLTPRTSNECLFATLEHTTEVIWFVFHNENINSVGHVRLTLT